MISRLLGRLVLRLPASLEARPLPPCPRPSTIRSPIAREVKPRGDRGGRIPETNRAFRQISRQNNQFHHDLSVHQAPLTRPTEPPIAVRRPDPPPLTKRTHSPAGPCVRTSRPSMTKRTHFPGRRPETNARIRPFWLFRPNLRQTPGAHRLVSGGAPGVNQRAVEGARGADRLRRIPAPARSSRGPAQAGPGGSCRTARG